MKIPQTSIFFARNISHRFPSFLIAFARISGKSNGNSGNINGKIWAKAMRKLGSGGIYFGQKLLLLPEFPIVFSRISHCFCPNFSFSKMCGGGGTVPPASPPPASYAYANSKPKADYAIVKLHNSTHQMWAN